MAKLAIVLSVVLLASITLSEEVTLSCIDELNNKINENINIVKDERDHALDKIGDKLETLMSKKPTVWENVKTKMDETPVIEFNERGDDYQVKYARQINDSACEKFVEQFGIQQVDRCASFLLYLISIDMYEIKNLPDKVIKYFIEKKMVHADDEGEVERNEKLCRKKITYVDFAITIISKAMISKSLNHSLKKIGNFMGDLSYCLVTQTEGSVSLYFDWHKACAYYDMA